MPIYTNSGTPLPLYKKISSSENTHTGDMAADRTGGGRGSACSQTVVKGLLGREGDTFALMN